MAICDKVTLQPGGEDPCDKETQVPPGAVPPGGLPDNELPFEPGIPDPSLPGGPNTPEVPPATPLPPTNADEPAPPVDNKGPYPDGPSGSGSGGCAAEFICLLESPIPSLLINPVDEVEGGETAGTVGEGPVYTVPLEVCEDEELLGDLPLNPVACSIDEDCPEGFVCKDGQCVSAQCEPACVDILEEGKPAEQFKELREKELDPVNGWEVTDREKEPYEQGSPYPFAGTLGKGKEFFDHSINCQAQNGQELWNINDGISHTDCFLPDKYAKIKWEPQGFVFCRRVDFGNDTQTWGDVYIGNLTEYLDGGTGSGERIPKDEQTSGRLFVQHSATLYDSLSVKEWAHFNDTVTVREATTLADNLFVRTDSALYDTLYVREKALMEETLIVKEHIFSEGKLTVAGRARVDLLISQKPHIYIGETCWTLGKYDVIDPSTFNINFSAQTYRADTISIPVLVPYEDPEYDQKIEDGDLFVDDPYCAEFCEREIIVTPKSAGSIVGGSTYVFEVELPECGDDSSSDFPYEYEFISSIGFAAYRAVDVQVEGDAELIAANGKRGAVLATSPGKFTMTLQATHGERMKLVGGEEVHLIITNPLSGNQDNAKA